jgi:hypothetical protein
MPGRASLPCALTLWLGLIVAPVGAAPPQPAASEPAESGEAPPQAVLDVDAPAADAPAPPDEDQTEATGDGTGGEVPSGEANVAETSPDDAAEREGTETSRSERDEAPPRDARPEPVPQTPPVRRRVSLPALSEDGTTFEAPRLPPAEPMRWGRAGSLRAEQLGQRLPALPVSAGR